MINVTNKRFLVFVIIVVLTLFPQSLLTGCESGFKRFTFQTTSDEDTVSYSFQLPARYDIKGRYHNESLTFIEVNPTADRDGRPGDENVTQQSLDYPELTIGSVQNPTKFATREEALDYYRQEAERLGLDARDWGQPYDYQMTTDRIIRYYNKQLKDFQLLSRRPTVVSGVPGEEIIFKFSASYGNNPGHVFTVIGRDIFFDRSGRGWSVGVRFLETAPGSVEADHMHLLKTLRISQPKVSYAEQGNINPTSYKTFILKKGLTHFTFEYPAAYQVSYIELHAVPDSISTVSFVQLATFAVSSKLPIIAVTIIHPSVGASKADELAMKRIDEIEADTRLQLLSRGPIKVNGVDGEQIIYSVKEGKEVWTDWSVFFDYGGYIWKISKLSDSSVSDEIELGLRHILETFKILN